MSDRFSIAQVTPYAWERAHEVNTHVREVSAELAARGHRVLIVAPSSSSQLVREGRRLIRADGAELLDRADGAPLLLAVGEAMETPLPGRRRSAALPMDVTRTLGDLFEHAPLDITHVHEPFAPSIAGAALRSSRALNVGSFHAPTERIVSTQVARKVVQLIFGRLDARTASYPSTAEIMARHFPATYRPLPPGAPALERAARPDGAPLRIAFVDEEERQALRLLLRALRHVETDAPWELVVLGGSGPSSTPLRADLRDRVRYVTTEDASEDELLQNADILVAASNGSEPQPALVARAGAAGAVPLASGLDVYADVVGDGERGLLFQARDPEALGAQLGRLLSDDALRERLRAAARPRPWSTVADEVEALYAEIAARRKDPAGDPKLRRRLAGRPLIDVDLHMHTDHSHDCATPVEVLMATAREKGLGAIAVTEHNEISGAQAAAALSEEYGVKVILAEEVKTASQGEVIGLFITEKIPRGMTLEETVAEIKRQGGLVYVPASVRPDARGPGLRAPARDHRGHRRDRGLQPARGVQCIQRGGRALRRQVPDPRGRRLGRPRRAGTRHRARADARLRRAAGVPGVAARGRDPDPPDELRLRAGAEVPADEGDPGGGPPVGEAATRAAGDPQGLMQGEGDPPGPSNPGAPVPATDDEIREKYLERAIREMNALTRDIQSCRHCPRGSLMPVLGSGHPQADVLLLKYAPQVAEIEEGVAFYGRSGTALRKSLGRLGVDPLAVYGTLCIKCPVGDGALADPICVARVTEEIAIVQPRLIVVMGEDALGVLNDLDLPLSAAVAWEPGAIQHLTPSIDVLVTPNIDDSLDEEDAKRAFWAAFRTLGDWWAELPPY